ncbi:MAG TPA: DUF1598 domain-containing protein [Pirellulales bacterium]|nr:DUF1598 domain-containing protein [Pirellulales bacterium]
MSSVLCCVGRRSGIKLLAARACCSALLLGVLGSTAQAQFVRQAVGGISIDAKGVLDNAERDHNGLRQFWLDLLKPVPGDLNQAAKLRKISLRGLAELIGQLDDQAALPDEVRFLAGLQRVEYVLVYPQLNDIVLVGFGEGWKIDDRGNMVGVTTGRPVMQLDDLLVALRTAEQAGREAITCSIDPTQEGLARLQQMAPQFMQLNLDPKVVGPQMEKAIGKQKVSFHVVPPTSRFAHVMLAADYRMKRLGMNFDQPPVKGLPSYLHMIKGSARTTPPNMLPRWWLTTNYEPLLTDNEGLVWQLRGQGVKAMSEEDLLGANGERTHTGKSSPAAQRWADQMTKKYDELSLKEPVFGELRNCMDLAVIAALILKEDLAAKASLDLSPLLDARAYPTEAFNVPTQVDTKVSYVHASSAYLLSASGGVELNTWAEASRRETTDDLKEMRDQVAEGRGKSWWWN